ncbi:hypothetical protein [Streptomyces sp. CC77]|uniref:hypothetical protein n=1 Tax=Streptomyces sp. CC77 TaxID=1906739 RepID=UPI0011134ABF|nr:hypothetical protein [Streptomyces sp. CC77]
MARGERGVRGPGRRLLSAAAAVCALAGAAAAAPAPPAGAAPAPRASSAPVAYGVRVQGAVAGEAGRTARVTYTYACPVGAGTPAFALRLADRTSGVMSAVAQVRAPRACDGAPRTRTDTVTADVQDGFRPGDGVVARVVMTVPGLSGGPETVSAARAMTLG